MSTKICKKCGKEKPLSEYNVNKKAKDGLQSYCKECQSEYFKANADKIRERSRQWRAEKKSTQASKTTPVKAKPAIYLGLQSFNLIEAERALISRAMRENPQMTQFEIAQLCGVSERTIQSKLEEFGLKKPGIPIGGAASLLRITNRRNSASASTGSCLKNSGTGALMATSGSM